MDDSIKVYTVARATIKEAQTHWNDLYSKAAITGTVTLLAGIAVGVLVLIETLSLPFIIVAVVLAVIGAAILYRAYEASLMYDAWKDPIEAIKADRKKCDPEQGGLANLMQNKLTYPQSVHQDEKKDIWWKTAKGLQIELNDLEKVQDSQKEAFVNKFFTAFNPFSFAAINFAFPSGDINDPSNNDVVLTLEKVLEVSKQFENYFKEYRDIKEKVASMINQYNKTRNEFLKKNKENWEISLTPFKTVHDNNVEIYRQERDRKNSRSRKIKF